jgi:16S rRNA (uracil1498-N3)-methyltransferase
MKKEKIHWFLDKEEIKKIKDDQLTISSVSLLHQFNRVLKFKTGELIILFDGDGTWYKCEIEKLEKKDCVLKILEKNYKAREENKIINLYFGIPKKNKFELILEKGTEVGITSFNPIVTDRTEKLNIKKERAERILVETCEQSENPILPSLSEVKEFNQVISNINPKNTFVFHTVGELININDFKFFGEVNILIGPEGGWSTVELETFKNKNFHVYKVGDKILKTETACIVIPFLFNIT